MKKIYMQPLIEVVKVNAEQMICLSGGEVLMTTPTQEESGNLGLGDGDYSDDLFW